MLLRVLELDGDIEKVSMGVITFYAIAHDGVDTCILGLCMGFQGGF